MSKDNNSNQRLFIKIKRENLPQVKDRYPFLYLEHGRLEIDDSSVKWIDSEGSVIRLPVATIQTILLGPGTSVTHEAIKTLTSANCCVCWVGEDSLLFYAVGQSPTADSRNFKRQVEISSDKKKSLEVARRMFAKRFPKEDIENKSLNELKGMEGYRVRALYDTLANKYHVGWKGRYYVPGKFELSDLTNKILTASNAALYGIITSAVYSMGYSPHIGFIHTGSPLPFVYDLADLYKDFLTIDLAFHLTFELAGVYNKYRVHDEFIKRVIDTNLLGTIGDDIKLILYGESDGRRNLK